MKRELDFIFKLDLDGERVRDLAFDYKFFKIGQNLNSKYKEYYLMILFIGIGVKITFEI